MTLKKGTVVCVYEDPITAKKFEGYGTVIRVIPEMSCAAIDADMRQVILHLVVVRIDKNTDYVLRRVRAEHIYHANKKARMTLGQAAHGPSGMYYENE